MRWLIFLGAASAAWADPTAPKALKAPATQAPDPDNETLPPSLSSDPGSGTLQAFRPSSAMGAASTEVILVVGAPGDERYDTIFSEEAVRWEKLCADNHLRCVVIGQSATGRLSDRDRLQGALAAEPKDGQGKLWLVLIGHGTFDGTTAKFNLRGPDFSAAELALWLKPFHRPLAVIDTSSASAPFLSQLSGPERVIVTATRSGDERNYARFGTYFAEAIGDPQSDLDRDGQTSLLEAFLSASARLAEFYRTAGRLATEHPLIDDNGDGLGTPPDWFQGVRAVKRAKDGATVDGLLAQQFVLAPSAEEQQLSPAARAERDRLELAVGRLRDKKSTLKPDDYYAQLEQLLLQLARLYQANESSSTPAH